MPNEFTNILLRARRRSIADMGRLEARFYRLYLEALNDVLAGFGNFDIDSKKKAEDFLAAIQRQEIKYGKAADRLIKKEIIDVFERVGRAHIEAIEAVSSQDNVRAPFSGISRDAFEDLYKRRNMGLTNSYRSLTEFQKKQSGLIIEKQLENAVLRGATWQDATQAIVDGLTRGDPELRRMAKNMARKSSGLGIWLERALENPEGRDDVGPLYIDRVKQARKIAYDARRIVRTEIAHAHHEADRIASARSPVVKGMKWNLSMRHGEAVGIDICDVYAEVDLHNMGDGVYPPEYLPPLPHPHCLCFMTHVLREPGEWQDPKQPAKEPRFVTEQMAKRILDKRHREGDRTVTEKFLQRTAEQINETQLLIARNLRESGVEIIQR